MPGVFDIGATSLQMQPFIDVRGATQDGTRIRGVASTTWVDLAAAVVMTSDNSELGLLTIENVAAVSATVGAAVFNVATSPKISDVTLLGHGGEFSIGIINKDASPTLHRINVVAEGNNASGIVNSGDGFITLRDSSVTARSLGGAGFGVGIYNFGGGASLSNVSVSASQQGVLMVGGSSIRIDRSTIEGSPYSLQVDGGQVHGVAVGASKLVGAVQPGFPQYSPVCAFSYDENYTALTSDCQYQ